MITTMVDKSRRKPMAANGCGHATPFVLTVQEAADLLRISKDLAYELVARGELPSLRLGRRIVVPLKPLLDIIEGPIDPNSEEPDWLR
jgi:excisionase family DNA binding protein